MIQSKYNLHYKNGAYVLCFNTKTGAIVLFSKYKFDSFVKDKLDTTARRVCFELGFYVNEGINEFEEIIEHCKHRVSKSNLYKYRILTTTACNAKCPYCYENGLSVHSMTLNTADKVASFILNEVSSGGKTQIEWFGGEPLLNTRVIDLISDRLNKELPLDVSFTSSIITNASRINDTIIDKIRNNWKTNRIQITIDGIGEEYEQVKGLGNKSFERLITTITKLTQINLHIDIRFNYDKHNYQSIIPFAKYFSSFPNKDRLSFYAAKIFSEESKRGYFDLEKETLYVDSIMHQYGLILGPLLLPKTFSTGCMALYPNFYTIDPQGRLFKCDRRLLDKNSISTIDNFTHRENHEAAEDSYHFAEKCQDCKIFPLCWGGCQYDRITGIYPCYLTTRIINERLRMILEDYSTNCSSAIKIISKGKRGLSTKINDISLEAKPG